MGSKQGDFLSWKGDCAGLPGKNRDTYDQAGLESLSQLPKALSWVTNDKVVQRALDGTNLP